MTSRGQPAGNWLIRPNQNSTGDTLLIALSFAGGGASAYRDWPKDLPAGVELVCVELPGRESRLREAPVGDLASVMDALRTALPPVMAGRRFALFGHSLGALLAFELARALRLDGLGEPVCLFASGREAPTRREPGRQLHMLGDDEFVDEMISRYDGIPQVLLDEPELMALFLPAMKADLKLTETYVYERAPPFACPVHILAGSQDLRLTNELLLPWGDETAGPAPLVHLPGGHFFIRESQRALLGYVRDALNCAQLAESGAQAVLSGTA